MYQKLHVHLPAYAVKTQSTHNIFEIIRKTLCSLDIFLKMTKKCFIFSMWIFLYDFVIFEIIWCIQQCFYLKLLDLLQMGRYCNRERSWNRISHKNVCFGMIFLTLWLTGIPLLHCKDMHLCALYFKTLFETHTNVRRHFLGRGKFRKHEAVSFKPIFHHEK